MAPEHVASNLALFGFGVSSLFFLWMAPRLDAWHEAIALRRVGFTFLVGATLAATYSALKSMGLTPISDLTGILLAAVLGWMAVSGHIILKLRLISAVIAPVITLILLLQFFVAPSPRGMVPMTGEETSLLVGIHVLTAVIGQAFAIVACAITAFYLWLQPLRKRRRLLD